MKKIFILLITVLIFSSCEELENQQPYDGPDVIRFASASTTVTELGGTIEIPVLTTRSSAFTATFSLSSDNAQEGVHYSIVNATNTLSFPEGVYSDTIRVQIIDNAEADGNKAIELTITPSDASISLGFVNDVQGLASNTLTIIDDDCPLDLDEFVGTYDVNEDNGAFVYTSEITLGASPNSLLVDNFWGSGLAAEITFDNSDPSNPTAYVLPQETNVVLCCGANAWVTSRPDANAVASGAAQAGVPDGSFSTCGLSFEVDILIYIPAQGTFNSSNPVNHVFVKQ